MLEKATPRDSKGKKMCTGTLSGRFHRDKTKYGSEEEGEINTVKKQEDVAV